jgi:hypothetical protein
MMIPLVYMLHIDTSLCYCIPEIYNQIFDAFRIDYIRSRRQLTWGQYITSLDMGIVHDGHGTEGNFYRIVDPRKFMMHAIRLGITITSTTPTRAPRLRKPSTIGEKKEERRKEHQEYETTEQEDQQQEHQRSLQSR